MKSTTFLAYDLFYSLFCNVFLRQLKLVSKCLLIVLTIFSATNFCGEILVSQMIRNIDGLSNNLNNVSVLYFRITCVLLFKYIYNPIYVKIETHGLRLSTSINHYIDVSYFSNTTILLGYIIWVHKILLVPSYWHIQLFT